MKACGCISLQSGAILIGLFKIIVYSIAISLTLLLAFTGLSVTQLKDRAFEKAQLLLKNNRVNNSEILIQLNETTSPGPTQDPVSVSLPASVSVSPNETTVGNITRTNSGNFNSTQKVLNPNPSAQILSQDKEDNVNPGNLTQTQTQVNQNQNQTNEEILENLNGLTDANLLMILGTDLLLNLIGIIFAIVLVLGAHHGISCLMNFWIFISTLLLLSAIALTVMTSNLFDLNLSPQILLTTGSTFSYSIYLLPLDLYFLLVVYFYQKEIKTSRNQLPF